ncbi:MAG: hypothetical protein ACR2N9_04755 [Acidimicrobiia bacterium]
MMEQRVLPGTVRLLVVKVAVVILVSVLVTFLAPILGVAAALQDRRSRGRP